MICALQHSNGKWIKAAMGTKNIRTLEISNVKFFLSPDIRNAKLIEWPDMDAVRKYGLRAFVVKIEDSKLKIEGKIIDVN